MKWVFEWNIPEFNGKTCRERNALYRQARNLDKRIQVMEILSSLLVLAPLLCSLMELLKHGYLPSFTFALILYVSIGIPSLFFLRAWWVNPRVKKAIQIASERRDQTNFEPG